MLIETCGELNYDGNENLEAQVEHYEEKDTNQWTRFRGSNQITKLRSSEKEEGTKDESERFNQANRGPRKEKQGDRTTSFSSRAPIE